MVSALDDVVADFDCAWVDASEPGRDSSASFAKEPIDTADLDVAGGDDPDSTLLTVPELKAVLGEDGRETFSVI